MTKSQYDHLFVYIPQFLKNLTLAKNNDEIIGLIQQSLILHLNLLDPSVFNILDDSLSNLFLSTLNTTLDPIFSTPEFSIILKDIIQTLLSGENLNQTRLIEEFLIVLAPSMVEPMKRVIYQLSPNIYEFAKDQTDPKVMLAYTIHAGESALHRNLRSLGIPYDTVFLGTTTTPIMTTTTTRRIIDLDLIQQIINLNKDRNDISNFLGNTGNEPLVPLDPEDEFDYS